MILLINTYFIKKTVNQYRQKFSNDPCFGSQLPFEINHLVVRQDIVRISNILDYTSIYLYCLFNCKLYMFKYNKSVIGMSYNYQHVMYVICTFGVYGFFYCCYHW